MVYDTCVYIFMSDILVTLGIWDHFKGVGRIFLKGVGVILNGLLQKGI